MTSAGAQDNLTALRMWRTFSDEKHTFFTEDRVGQLTLKGRIGVSSKILRARED